MSHSSTCSCATCFPARLFSSSPVSCFIPDSKSLDLSWYLRRKSRSLRERGRRGALARGRRESMSLVQLSSVPQMRRLNQLGERKLDCPKNSLRYPFVDYSFPITRNSSIFCTQLSLCSTLPLRSSHFPSITPTTLSEGAKGEKLEMSELRTVALRAWREAAQRMQSQASDLMEQMSMKYGEEETMDYLRRMSLSRKEKVSTTVPLLVTIPTWNQLYFEHRLTFSTDTYQQIYVFHNTLRSMLSPLLLNEFIVSRSPLTTDTRHSFSRRGILVSSA